MYKVLFISTILFSVLFLMPSKVLATSPGYNGKIAFVSTRDGNDEIYVMNADGSYQTRITNNTASDKDPDWSPDGTKIAFTTGRDGNNEIYVMNADGSNIQRITTNVASDGGASWSPDSQWISFHSNRDGNNEIYKIRVDGTVSTRLTTDSGSDVNPYWSPNGSKILFQSTRDTVGSLLYLMGIDGSNQVRINQGTAYETGGSWMSDGSHIVYAGKRGSIWDIFTQNMDTIAETQLTSDSVTESTPRWSPLGDKITFITIGLGNIRHIWTMTSSGSNAVQITDNANDDRYPAWQTIPNRPPETHNDSITLAYNTVSSSLVLSNDTDEEALNPTNLTVTSQPTHGSASVNSTNGNLTFTPTTNFVGSDQLTYQICDSFFLDQKCATGVLGITVNAIQAPVLTLSSIGAVQIVAGTQTYQFTGHRPTFAGTAEAGSTIKVEIHSDPIMLTTTADSLGNWSVTPESDVPNGKHTVSVTATLNGQSSVLADYILNINTGLAETGMPMWPMVFVGVILIFGLRKYLRSNHA